MIKKKDGSFEQYYKNLPFVKEEQKESIKAAGFINAADFGKDNEFILNSDPASNSITHN